MGHDELGKLACHVEGGVNAESALLALPDGLLLAHLLPRLSPADRKALRQLCARARALVNSAVAAIALHGDARPGERLGGRFPGLDALHARDAPGAPVTDDGLIAFLAGSPSLPRLRRADLKHSSYTSGRALRFLAEACEGLAALLPSRWADACALHHLARLCGLEHLDLGDPDADVCQLDDGALVAAAALTALTSLSLQRCKWITDAGLARLAPLTRLASLNLASTGVTGVGLPALAGARGLQQLDLSDCRQLGDAGLGAACAALAQLRALRLGGTAVTNAGLRHLASLPALRALDLGGRFEVDDAGLVALAACEALAELAAGSFNLTSAAPPGCRPSPPDGAFGALEALRLGGAFPSKGLRGLFPLPALRRLHLAGIDTATDATLRHVASQTSLCELSVSGGYKLTGGGLAALRPLRALALLALSACPAVEPAALRSLSADLCSLSELRVSCCPQLGPKGAAARGLPRALSLPADLDLLCR
jgi:F-box/leucine-rich repeat protein 14